MCALRFTDEDVFFKKEKKLGAGTYGTVEKIELTMEGEKKVYALKRNFIQGDDRFTESSRELDILNSLRHHPLVISLKLVKLGNPYGKEDIPIVNSKSFDDMSNDYLHFIFECGIMNLANWIDKKESSFEEVKQFMTDLLIATEYIHNSGFIHRDLKPGNVVIFPPVQFFETPSKNFASSSRYSPLETNLGFHRAKIIDFGMAKPLVSDGINTPGVVTYYYRAPEIINELDYNEKIDTWSLGCIFYEMLFKTHFIKSINKETDKNLKLAILKNAIYPFEPYEITNILGYKGKVSVKVNTIQSRIEKMPHFQKWHTENGNGNINGNGNGNANKNQNGNGNANKNQNGNGNTNRNGNGNGNGNANANANGNGNTLVTEKKNINNIEELLIGLLRIDPKKRLSTTEALELPFFEDKRDYINEMRKKYKPIAQYEHEYLIPVCQERKWMSSFVIETYNEKNKNEWYQHRRLFHAIDLFDKVLRYFLRLEKCKENNNNIWSKEKTKKFYYACLFYSVKYFATLEHAWNLTDLLPPNFNSQEIINDICEKANFILENILEFKFYRHTLYEAICEKISPSDPNFEFVIRNAIQALTKNTDNIKDKTPSVLCKELLSKL
jgi:serine/threonine protein kinase